MAGINRFPEIPSELAGQYARLSKADLMDVCISLAQQIYGEATPADELMKKIVAERDLLKSQR